MKTKWVVLIGIGCLLIGMVISASIIGIIWTNQIRNTMLGQLQCEIATTYATLKYMKEGKPESCAKFLEVQLSGSLKVFDSLTNGLGLPVPFYPEIMAKSRELLAQKSGIHYTEQTNSPYSSPAAGSNR
jgi:hypothetical protein